MKLLKYIIAASLALAACQEKSIQPDYVNNEPKTEVAKTLIEKTDMIAALYSDSETVITDGLTMTALSYLGMDGCPMRIWFLKADLTKPNLCLEQAYAGDVFQSVGSTLTEMAKKEDRANHFVWAATNSDFFGTDIQKNPQGIFHHEGKCLKSIFNVVSADTPRCFFYMTPDKKIRMADKADYKEVVSEHPDIVEAGSGGPFLIIDGVAQNIPVQKDGLSNRHPRTCMGVEKNGTTVWMMVADGRRYTWSNGLYFEDMCKIMSAVGCYNMMNLDGGGSSEMIVRASKDENEYNIINWPSDNGGQERTIYTGILFVTKK
ncbi:MAG: phosphodiester glycosidase family protein [Bacteroidales bacterium]|nr:phosphodiester glycosidase family protein [Bacteroidales bacterium]